MSKICMIAMAAAAAAALCSPIHALPLRLLDAASGTAGTRAMRTEGADVDAPAQGQSRGGQRKHLTLQPHRAGRSGGGRSRRGGMQGEGVPEDDLLAAFDAGNPMAVAGTGEAVRAPGIVAGAPMPPGKGPAGLDYDGREDYEFIFRAGPDMWPPAPAPEVDDTGTFADYEFISRASPDMWPHALAPEVGDTGLLEYGQPTEGLTEVGAGALGDGFSDISAESPIGEDDLEDSDYAMPAEGPTRDTALDPEDGEPDEFSPLVDDGATVALHATSIVAFLTQLQIRYVACSSLSTWLL